MPAAYKHGYPGEYADDMLPSQILELQSHPWEYTLLTIPGFAGEKLKAVSQRATDPNTSPPRCQAKLQENQRLEASVGFSPSEALKGVSMYDFEKHLIIINGRKLKRMDKPPFDSGHWGSEKDYKDYLLRIQPLIEEYRSTGWVDNIPFDFRNDPEDKIEEIRKENALRGCFRSDFLQAINYIVVKRCRFGKYRVTTNGRHRAYIAKKYGLNLIVWLDEKEV